MLPNNLITTQKNLLAFSGGVDSTALFFLLVEKNIPFDIAIVNYHQREQSNDEVNYAKKLAKKYNKKCFIANFDEEKFSEKTARDFRYKFFDEIIENNFYESLITAHQLNDKLEWFLMQLTKGAGLNELVGFEKKSKRNNYIVYKPLLETTKESLLEYLQNNNIQYFIDETNQDSKYKRNYFRKEFSDRLLSEFTDGIKNSFVYLQNDIDSMNSLYELKKIKELSIAKFKINDINIMMRFIDSELKQRGILISKDTRDEIKLQKSIVVSHKIAIEIVDEKVWIAPSYNITMDKKFKEKCRIEKIPTNIRSYLFSLNIEKLNFDF
jgi:tRNA(Ile)-lysidine synthase